jgi:hypothetical protein
LRQLQGEQRRAGAIFTEFDVNLKLDDYDVTPAVVGRRGRIAVLCRCPCLSGRARSQGHNGDLIDIKVWMDCGIWKSAPFKLFTECGHIRNDGGLEDTCRCCRCINVLSALDYLADTKTVGKALELCLYAARGYIAGNMKTAEERRRLASL